MAKPVTGQTTFGANTSGTTTQLDNNFLLAYNALNDLNTYSNYFIDSGLANAYVVTLASGLTAPLTAGLAIQMKVTNANTGASTLNFNGTGAVAIERTSGTALSSGDMPSGAIVTLTYTGSVWMLAAILPNASVKVKVGNFTRNIASTGSQSITGVGFQPKAIAILGGVNAAAGFTTFNGFYDGTTQGNTAFFNSNSYRNVTSDLIFVSDAGASNFSTFTGSSLDSDGFTGTWGKTGSPTGTGSFMYLAIG